MPWVNSNATWPASAAAIHTSAEPVLDQVSAVMNEAINRLAEPTGKVSYTRPAISNNAQALLNLRSQLNTLLVNGKILTVTPAVYGIGEGGYLSAQQAINALAAKLADNADWHTPANQQHALVLLLSAASPGQLLNQLTPICNLLAAPALLAYMRHLQKSAVLQSEKMQQNTPALTPRWTQAHSINLDPLRKAETLLGTQLAQLESLSSDASTPLAKLSALANKRSAMLVTLKADIAALTNVSGNIWRYGYTGSARALATELQKNAVPVNQPASIAMVISSPQPLTFFKDLFPGETMT